MSSSERHGGIFQEAVSRMNAQPNISNSMTVLGILYETTSEKDLLAMAVQAARLCGYLCYHTWNSSHSAKGYPDLTCCRLPSPAHPDADLIIRELKTERGKVTPAQQAWIDGFVANGIDAAILRPSNLDAFIERLKRGHR
jgi:hypothetical protein